ncbi:MAG: hypothetical protein LBC79_01375 [Deltaproteobacteria bacterium]|jgi:hypothetical protein|nr:hypothetical protein [Deltaproteobacteria bacterium]
MSEIHDNNPLDPPRTHVEGLGDPWAALLADPAALMPQVVGTVLQEGGSRPAWQAAYRGREHILLAWPQESAIRAAVVLRGEEGDKLTPATAVPLLEGVPNDMTTEDLHPWANGVEADVAACRNEGAQPLWFYTPFYFRDREALMTPGVRHTFMLSGLAYGVRKALLDDMTIADGPRFEIWAEKWLEENPDKTRLDVPPWKLSLRGASVLLPSAQYTVYQLRAPILSLEEAELSGEKVYILRLAFGLDTPQPLELPLYAPARVCKRYVPQEGDEIDAIVWLQGRLLD